MSRSYKQDYAFGKANEARVLNLIKPLFEDDIVDVGSRYATTDFKGSKYNYELKSRTNACKDYPTTLLPHKKVFSDNHIFLFLFTDGLYYIKYSKEVFDTFEVKPFKRKWRSGITDKEALYYYIPIDTLIEIPIPTTEHATNE